MLVFFYNKEEAEGNELNFVFVFNKEEVEDNEFDCFFFPGEQ